jgi:hypothetical protein
MPFEIAQVSPVACVHINDHCLNCMVEWEVVWFPVNLNSVVICICTRLKDIEINNQAYLNKQSIAASEAVTKYLGQQPAPGSDEGGSSQSSKLWLGASSPFIIYCIFKTSNSASALRVLLFVEFFLLDLTFVYRRVMSVSTLWVPKGNFHVGLISVWPIGVWHGSNPSQKLIILCWTRWQC